MSTPDKEKRIDETLRSLDGLQRPDAPPDLYEGAMARMRRPAARVVPLRPAAAWSAAACIVLLVLANLFACWRYGRPPSVAGGVGAVASEYFSFANPPQL